MYTLDEALSLLKNKGYKVRFRVDSKKGMIQCVISKGNRTFSSYGADAANALKEAYPFGIAIKNKPQKEIIGTPDFDKKVVKQVKIDPDEFSEGIFEE